MTRRAPGLVAGVLVAGAASAAGVAAGLPHAATVTAAITGLVATWWVMEPIPIPATSLLPLGLFPLFGVLTSKEAAAAYGHHMILLLMGGFMLSAAIEKSGLHRRMALGMLRLTGGSGKRLVLGFMLASALCSMWMSNTATTLMLLPVAMAVLGKDSPPALRTALLLGIAYAASIGGMATPVGTPPNVIFMGIYTSTTHQPFSFLQWMAVGMPVAAVLVPLAWLLLTRKLGPSRPAAIPAPGAWRSGERRVLFVFAMVVLAWVFRSAPAGGWTLLLGRLTSDPHAFASGITDSTVALVGVAALFLVPSGEGAGDPLLDWPTAARIPWGLLLLFSGGIAIADAFRASGLSAHVGASLASLASLPAVLTIGALCLVVTFLTEVTSNTATANLLMPILAAAAASAGIDARLLMIPAVLSCSCAFMLPVATAPNAIVYGTGYVSTRDMAREGLWLNFIGVAVVTALALLLL